MYLTRDAVISLFEIILKLNSMESEEERAKLLDEHVEDPALLVKSLKKLNKSKIPKKGVIAKDNNGEADLDLYEEKEIYSIFEQKEDKVIMEEYSLTALKQMYTSIYKRKPTSSYTKERIISTLRNRIHTMNRTEAFMKLAEEREKKKDK